MVVAFSPDIDPADASKIASFIPDASSTTSKTWSLWTPWSASADPFSGLETRKLMKLSEGDAFKRIWSVNTSSWSFNTSGNTVIHFLTSAPKASCNWEWLGAVTTVFWGNLVSWCQIINHDAHELFPTPWPDFTEMRLFPCATQLRTCSCHLSGVSWRTSLTNNTGSLM